MSKIMAETIKMPSLSPSDFLTEVIRESEQSILAQAVRHEADQWLTARAVLEQLAAIQMIDVHIPTTDGRCLVLPRYTEPEPQQAFLLEKLKLTLPEQPPSKIYASQLAALQEHLPSPEPRN